MTIATWQKAVILDCIRRGMPAAHAARQAGVWHGTAARYAVSAGFKLRRGPRKGWRPPPRFPAEAVETAIRMVAEGATLRAAGAAVGASHEAVNQWCARAGVVERHSAAGKSRRRAEALRLVARGASDQEVAQRLGVCKASVFLWRKAAGIPANRKRKGRNAKEEAARHGADHGRERRDIRGGLDHRLPVRVDDHPPRALIRDRFDVLRSDEQRQESLALQAVAKQSRKRARKVVDPTMASFVFRCPTCGDYRRYSAIAVEEETKELRCHCCGTIGIKPVRWKRYLAIRAAERAAMKGPGCSD